MQKQSCLRDVVVTSQTGEMQKAKHMRGFLDASDEQGPDLLPEYWLDLEDGGRVNKLLNGTWEHEDSGEIYKIVGD